MTRNFVRWGALQPHLASRFADCSQTPFKISGCSRFITVPELHSPLQPGQSRSTSFVCSANQTFAEGVISDWCLNSCPKPQLFESVVLRRAGATIWKNTAFAFIPLPGD